ncbi:TerD family protein [Photobacterium japonica]|uniref:TerD family protein n=1 Tax=Photobacterium japonica TaxID=2910235 RepID=UPI003D125A47
MAVSLVKGGNVSLTKEAPTMKVALAGLGWDARATDGQDFDLDCSVFMVGDDNKVLSDTSFIFFNNTHSACGSVVHNGDNKTGEGDGDDETVTVSFDNVPANVKKLVFAVTIHDAESLNQNFGQVSNAYMRIVNNDNSSEIARFDLSEDMSTETAMIFGELYRHNADWKFKAVGQGYAGGLAALAREHGVNV